jgi:hypothetical protein
MPAPKMILDGVTINQPPYGYTAQIYTGIKWDMVGDSYKGYVKSKPYFKCNFDSLMLTEEMQSNLKTRYSSNATLQLQSGSGLYPFSPLFQSSSYSVRILNNSYSGVLQSPWKYTENSIELLYNADVPVYENSQTPVEGAMAFRDGATTNEKIITGIREPESAPDIELPENHNTVICLSGQPATVENKRNGYELYGITSDIEIKGSLTKISQILKFILSVGINSFYVNLPDYYLFGRKLNMRYWTTEEFYAWAVRCISNPIEVTHDFLNSFTIKLQLALVRI